MRCFFRVVRGSCVMTLFQTANRQVKNDLSIDLPGGMQYYKAQHHSGTKTLNTSHTGTTVTWFCCYQGLLMNERVGRQKKSNIKGTKMLDIGNKTNVTSWESTTTIAIVTTTISIVIGLSLTSVLMKRCEYIVSTGTSNIFRIKLEVR